MPRWVLRTCPLLVEEGLEEGHVRRLVVAVDHALVANVLVRPDGPRDLALAVQAQLILEHGVSMRVGLVRVGIVVLGSVHGAKLAV